MGYTIGFQYMGYEQSYEREFNIDSVGILYKFDDIKEFRGNIKLLDGVTIRLNDNRYYSRGGIFDISDNTMSYFVTVRHVDDKEITTQSKGQSKTHGIINPFNSGELDDLSDDYSF